MHIDDLNKKLKRLLKLETQVPEFYPRDPGIWIKHDIRGWELTDKLPYMAIGDIEVYKKRKEWVPILGTFLSYDGYWYIWNNNKDNIYDYSPRILIGHNALEHDSKFLITFQDTRIIDTMLLMKEMFGVKPEEQAAYKKLKQNHAKGLNVPPWFHLRCESSLKASCKFLLGEDLKSSKEVDGLAKYCAKDVYATLRLSQRLIPLAISQGIDIYQQVNKKDSMS